MRRLDWREYQVLREFMDAMSSTHPLDAPARIAEYAAKLRLAEEDA